MRKRFSQDGFTLLELFVVVMAIIIALLVVFFMRSGG
jgi:type II secretory pathway pseudopilin PulG